MSLVTHGDREIIAQEVVRLNYQVIFPVELDEYDWAETEARGWIGGVRVVWGGGECSLSIFDETRLPQAIEVDIKRLGYFSAKNIIVVRRVAHDEIMNAVSVMARRGFVDL